MGKLRGLLLLLISVMVLNGCKETPTDTSTPTYTELEVRNNSGSIDIWFVEQVLINVKPNVPSNEIYFNTNIKHSKSGSVSFKKEEVENNLKNLRVDLIVKYHPDGTQRERLTTYLDFTLGEKRIVNVICTNYFKPNECRGDGLEVTVVE